MNQFEKDEIATVFRFLNRKIKKAVKAHLKLRKETVVKAQLRLVLEVQDAHENIRVIRFSPFNNFLDDRISVEPFYYSEVDSLYCYNSRPEYSGKHTDRWECADANHDMIDIE